MHQKGVSPLVATVMLIVIVVSLVALISGWLTQMFAESRETISNRTSSSLDCSGASIKISSAYLTQTGVNNASARVIIENDGLVDQISIVSAQLYNSTGDNFSTSNVLPIAFPRGSLKTLSFVNASVNNCSVFSQIVVSTQCNSASFKAAPIRC